MLPSTPYQHELKAEISTGGSSESKPSEQHSSDPTLGNQEAVLDGLESQAYMQDGNSPVAGDDQTADESKFTSSKKRIKVTKKGVKLDAKSKLEKSRQSARECRARKKLRYQYLEDLVCNREKAVTKLREELQMFCELSKQMEVGSISESDKLLLQDQTKENNRNESSSTL